MVEKIKFRVVEGHYTLYFLFKTELGSVLNLKQNK